MIEQVKDHEFEDVLIFVFFLTVVAIIYLITEVGDWLGDQIGAQGGKQWGK